jgi:hypothetical protein
MSMRLRWAAPISIVLTGLGGPVSADVITDWNEKAVAFGVSRNMGPPPAERICAMVHVAMFDAVNSIERKYRPYLVQLPAQETTSKDAAAAVAAGTVLAGINPQAQAEMKSMLAAYLAAMPDSPAKVEGIKLGEAVAAKILEARGNDGVRAPDTYRPRTTPGVYVTTAPTWAPQWPGVKPFAMTSASQFRPAAPIALTSKEWAVDYNEIKEGARSERRVRPGGLGFGLATRPSRCACLRASLRTRRTASAFSRTRLSDGFSYARLGRHRRRRRAALSSGRAPNRRPTRPATCSEQMDKAIA